jgi:diaminopimelate epimerase
MKFAKGHGLGNDFILVAESEFPEPAAAWARRLCDRHEGIGGDGVLVYAPQEGGVRMRLLNADGSDGEVSGNGVRCLAAFAVSRLGVPRQHVVTTPVGPRPVEVEDLAGRFRVATDLGPARLRSDLIPVALEPTRDFVIDWPLKAGQECVMVTATSLGNPHCALFYEQEVDDALLARLGPLLENHPFFPNRTNVEFVTVRSRCELRVRFWERGVGYTRASGTGAASAAVASMLKGLADRRVRVVCTAARSTSPGPRAAATSGRWARWSCCSKGRGRRRAAREAGARAGRPGPVAPRGGGRRRGRQGRAPAGRPRRRAHRTRDGARGGRAHRGGGHAGGGARGRAGHRPGRRDALPGLIDLHTHLPDRQGVHWETALTTTTPGQAALWGARNALVTLRAGFTTCRDMGPTWPYVDVDLRDAIEQGAVPGPRLTVAGNYVSSTGGAGDARQFSIYVDVPTVRNLADGPDEIVKAIRTNFKHGADFVKLLVTGAVLSKGIPPGAQQYSDAEIQAAVGEARRWGRPVASHAHGAAGIKAAIRAGVRTVDHGSELDDEAIAMLKATRDTFYVPTLATSDAIVAEDSNVPASEVERERAIRAMQDASFKRALAAGLPTGFGTDASVVPHGLNAREFVVRVRMGQKPMDAIVSATSLNASILGVVRPHRSVEAGKLADLVAVLGDPLADITPDGRDRP